jgi:hypothetical protein
VTETGELPSLGIAAAIWWIISGLIALYTGGWIAGRLSGAVRKKDGALHGFVAWSMETLLMFFLLASTFGALVGGAFGLIKTGAPVVASAATALPNSLQTVMPGNMQSGALGNVRAEIQATLQNRPPAENAQVSPMAEAQIMASVMALVVSSDADRDVRKQDTANLLAANTNLPPDEARSTVERWDQSLQSVRGEIQDGKQKAKDAAAAASNAAGKTAFASFVMLALGAIAASMGGSAGAPRLYEETANV